MRLKVSMKTVVEFYSVISNLNSIDLYITMNILTKIFLLVETV